MIVASWEHLVWRMTVTISLFVLLFWSSNVHIVGSAHSWRRWSGRTILMQQGRTAADEWEASSRQGILESGTVPMESTREEPHPLRTQDWKLEARDFSLENRMHRDSENRMSIFIIRLVYTLLNHIVGSMLLFVT